MFLKNELLPDIEIVDLTGKGQRLWDFRQKTHLLLIFGEGAARVDAALAAKRKLWDWLGVRIIACAQPAPGFENGAYAVDRYGRFIEWFALDDELADRAEKEFLYYDARHC
jgi:hypothetical protein